jgi:TolA-binding protein
MKTDESSLKSIRSHETRARSREDCLSADVLAAIAAGQLSGSDRDRAADHLASCADCAEELQLLQPLQAWSERTAAAYGREPQTKTRSTWISAWQLAAVTVVIAVVGVGIYRTMVVAPAPGAIAQPAVPVASLARIEITAPDVRLSASRALATRGAPNQKAFLDAFGKAIEPYRHGRYAEAAAALRAVAASYPDAYEPLFYQAVSSLLAGDAAVATEAFNRLRPLAPADMQDEIRLYRAAALQRGNDDDGARAELRTLCDGAGTYRDRACALLR